MQSKMLFATFTAIAAALSVLTGPGADRVVDLQHTDGQWGFPLTAPPTYSNITGTTAPGPLTAYAITNDAGHLASAQDAGNALVGRTADWVGTYNPEFLVNLSDATATSDPTSSAQYLTQAQSSHNDLAAGTYTRQGTDYDTNGWISQVQNGRDGDYINYRPYEFSSQAIAADRLGTPSQRAAFVQAVQEGIDTLDSGKGFDLAGLATGIRGLATLGEDFDPTTGAFAAADSLSDLANTLADSQNANGSWYSNSALTSPSSSDEHLETTALSMLGLFAANDNGQYDDEILGGRDYLIGQQLTNGGWLKSPGGTEYANTDGDVVWALSATSAVPTPASAGLAGLAIAALGGSGLMRRRRRELV